MLIIKSSDIGVGRKHTREHICGGPRLYVLTNLFSHLLVGEGRRSCLAEQDNSPLSALRELQALVVDLVRQLACGREDDSANA